MAVEIIPTPSYTEVRIADLKPGLDWISSDGVLWHRLRDLNLDLPIATLTVGNTAASATTVPCDPGGYVLRLDPADRPRR